jgi:NAD(P) transhydrogenase subunit alpha
MVITTAQLFGRPAPRLLDHNMLAGMQPGSVVIDMAVESGGNVEGSVLDQVTEISGVRVVGFSNLPGHFAETGRQMYSANLGNFVEHFWDKQTKTFLLNRNDEIIKGALITHEGEIVSEMYKSIVNK